MESLSKERLLEELRKRDEEIARLRQENALLRQKIDLLVRRIFGSSSETMSADQLELFVLGESGPKKLTPPRARRPFSPRRKSLGRPGVRAAGHAGRKIFRWSKRSLNPRK